MHVVIMENQSANLAQIRQSILLLYPEAWVKGFTDGDMALAWCESHSSEVDLFFGNWWNEEEEPHGPEGANIISLVQWKRKPMIILCGESELFQKWSERCGADGYLVRPVTQENLSGLMSRMKH